MSYWLLKCLHIDNTYRLGIVVYSKHIQVYKSFIQLKVSYVASDYRAFTIKTCTQTVVYMITLKEKIIGRRHSQNCMGPG